MCHVRAFENGKRFGLVLSNVPLMFFSRMPDFDMHSSHDLLPHAPCARHIVSNGPGCLHRFSSIIGFILIVRFAPIRLHEIQHNSNAAKKQEKKKEKRVWGRGFMGVGAEIHM